MHQVSHSPTALDVLISAGCKLYERSGQYVLFDPVSLESVFLSRAELELLQQPAASGASEIDHGRDRLLEALRGFGFSFAAPEAPIGQLLRARVEAIAPIRDVQVGVYRVVVTDKCNLACAYCFVDTNTGQPDMTKDDLEYSLGLLMRQSFNTPQVNLQWFGGEPTLRFDLMQHGDAVARRLAAETGVAIRHTVVTNAVKVTDEMLEHFEAYGYGVGVSLDGWPELNRKNRYLLSGKSADERVLRNLERLVALAARSEVYVGVNLTTNAGNVEQLPEIVDYVITQLGIKFIYVNTPIPYDGKWFVGGDRLARKLFEARLVALAKRGQVFSPYDRIYQALDSRVPKMFDRGPTTDLVVLPGRRISLCGINWKDQSFVHPIEALAADRNLLARVAKRLVPTPECEACPAAAVCGGPSENDISMRGGVLSLDPDHCAFFQTAVERALWDTTALQ